MRSMMHPALPVRLPSRSRSPQLSPEHRKARPCALLVMASWKPAAVMGTVHGTTALTTTSQTRLTWSCRPPTAWTGTPCSSRQKRPYLSKVRMPLLTIRRCSAISCPASQSLLRGRTAHTAMTGILRSSMAMAPVRPSMIQLDSHRRAETIRCMRMFVGSSGSPYTAILLWNASRYLKTESLSMMGKISALYRWKLFAIRVRRAALRHRQNVLTVGSRHQSARSKHAC